MMKATELLMEEHRVIERVLNALETAAQRLEQGQAIRAGFFAEVADFSQGFADGCHHKKEEQVLFKAMTNHGLPERAGPIGVMLAEHEQGRAYSRALREAARQLAAGDDTARGTVLRHARDYIMLLRQHIAKEDNVLFPMAANLIPPAEQTSLAEDFERIEHEETGEGIHEKYLALIEALEKEAIS